MPYKTLGIPFKTLVGLMRSALGVLGGPHKAFWGVYKTPWVADKALGHLVRLLGALQGNWGVPSKLVRNDFGRFRETPLRSRLWGAL